MNAKVIGIGILLLRIWVVMAIAVPDAFLSGNNTENLMWKTISHAAKRTSRKGREKHFIPWVTPAQDILTNTSRFAHDELG